jgi:hypothetical protein
MSCHPLCVALQTCLSASHCSGDSAMVLTKEQAGKLRTWDLQRYSNLKARVLAGAASLTALGTAVAAAAAGPGLAVPFAFGGSSGVLYQYLLQRRVDAVRTAGNPGPKTSEVKPGLGLRAAVALADPAVRAVLIGAGAVGSVAILHMAAAEVRIFVGLFWCGSFLP